MTFAFTDQAMPLQQDAPMLMGGELAPTIEGGAFLDLTSVTRTPAPSELDTEASGEGDIRAISFDDFFDEPDTSDVRNKQDDDELVEDNPPPPPIELDGRGDGIPDGFTAYGDGSYYMSDRQGRLHFTPAYQQRVDAGYTDWWGVATDLAWITGNSLAGVLSAPYNLAAGALANGLEALDELNED